MLARNVTVAVRLLIVLGAKIAPVAVIDGLTILVKLINAVGAAAPRASLMMLDVAPRRFPEPVMRVTFADHSKHLPEGGRPR